MTERQKPKTIADLERMAGIERTEMPRPTQRDVERLTYMRIRRWPAWRRKLRGLR